MIMDKEKFFDVLTVIGFSPLWIGYKIGECFRGVLINESKKV